MVCKNCGNSFTGNFCNACGQSAAVKRFAFSYFVKETFFSSLDIEKGFFQTIKVLFKSPGKAIRQYVEGRRLSLYVPGKFLLLIGTVATFISIHFNLFLSDELDPLSARLPVSHLGDFLLFAQQYTTLINVVAIPVFAFFSWLIFLQKGFNYTENLILNIYITAQQLVMLIFIFPAVFLFPATKEEVIAIYGILTFAYNLWVYVSFFEVKGLKDSSKVVLIIVSAYLAQFVLNYSIYVAAGWFEQHL